MSIRQHFDVLIIGNGILAYSTAYAILLESTLKIGIVGRSNRLHGATPASGAMFGCFGEVTKSSLSSVPGRTKLEMDIKATALWSDWLAQINDRVGENSRVSINPGTFVILNTKSSKMDDENYSAILATLDQYQQPYQIVEPSSIPGLEPVEDCRPLRSVYLPNEGSINSLQVLANLQSIAEQSSSITIIDDTVQSLHLCAGKIDYVKTKAGEEIAATCVLIAAGVESQSLIDTLPEIANRIPRLFPGVGCSIVVEQTTPACTSVIRTPNRSFACGLHVVPRGDDCLYVGASNEIKFQPEVNPMMSDVLLLIECAIEQIHQRLQRSLIVGWKVGNRPVSVDTFPLIGETSVPGLWVLTGTNREGFHLSPLLAKHLANQILRSEPLFDDRLFQPERLPIQYITKEQAIEQAVQYYISVGYEYSINIPKDGWQDMLREMLFNKVQSVYDRIGGNYVLPPEFITMADVDRQKFISYFQQYYEALV